MSDITQLPIVGADALNELKDLAGEECAGIYQEFFNEFASQLSELESAISASDYATIESISHSIKGSSSSLGMLRLSKFASIIEEAAKSDQVSPMDDLANCGLASQTEVTALLA